MQKLEELRESGAATCSDTCCVVVSLASTSQRLLFLLYCFDAILFVITLQICYVSTWVGLLSNRVDLLSNRVGLLSNGVGLFSGERVLESTPTPLFEPSLKFIAHGRIFESLWL